MNDEQPAGNHRADSAHELLAKGEVALGRLRLEAAAARAEARQRELEGIMSQARSGDLSALEQWLETHEFQPKEISGVDDEFLFDSRSAATQRDGLEGGSSGNTIRETAFSNARHTSPKTDLESWEQLESHSLARLKSRCDGATNGPLAAAIRSFLNSYESGGRAVVTSEPIEKDADLTGSKDCITESNPAARNKTCSEPGSSKAANRAIAPEVNPESRSGISAKAISDIVAGMDSQQKEDQKRQHKKVVVFSGLSGIATSILAHLLLLVLLAIITLKMPSPPAGMAFESTSSNEEQDVFELTQPATTELETAEMEPVEPQESALEAVSELAEISASMNELKTDDVGQSLSSAATAASSAVSAATATMSASASFFGAAAGGNCFCYVIDGSGSMRGGPWEAAKVELYKSLASLKSNQRFYIIFFNRQLEAIPLPGQREPAPRALYATPDNIMHARRWLEGLKIGVGASPNKALSLAISKEPDAIYLLTDGVTKVDVAAYLRETNRVTDLINGEQILVPIHAIAFYSLKGQDLLKKIALENKGQYVYVPDPR